MSGKFDYRDKIVLLTGASGGLGSSMARMLSDAGSYLVLSARSREALEELRASLSHPENADRDGGPFAQGGGDAPGPRGGIAPRTDRRRVNNAGLGYFATMEEADEERLRYLFEVNMFAPLALARELIPGMKARGSGRIVNVVSFAGRVPIVTSASYGGSKSALAIMMNTMRLELAGTGIDVINIYPGPRHGVRGKRAQGAGTGPAVPAGELRRAAGRYRARCVRGIEGGAGRKVARPKRPSYGRDVADLAETGGKEARAAEEEGRGRKRGRKAPRHAQMAALADRDLDRMQPQLCNVSVGPGPRRGGKRWSHEGGGLGCASSTAGRGRFDRLLRGR